jgi:hypothetical protein
MKNVAKRQATSDLNEIEALQIGRETLGGVNEP